MEIDRSELPQADFARSLVIELAHLLIVFDDILLGRTVALEGDREGCEWLLQIKLKAAVVALDQSSDDSDPKPRTGPGCFGRKEGCSDLIRDALGNTWASIGY